MKYTKLLVAGLFLTAIVSCQKEEKAIFPSEEKSGIEMTIGVSIAGDDTKATYDYQDSPRCLKFSWEIGDKISVVTYDDNAYAITNDIFTATSGGKTATFTGTYTGTANGTSSSRANIIRVVYPALTGESTNYYYIPGADNQACQKFFQMARPASGSAYSHLFWQYSSVIEDGSLNLVRDRNLMIGNLTSTTNPTTVLTPLINVFRLVIDTSVIPAGKRMYNIQMSSSKQFSEPSTSSWGFNTFLDFDNVSKPLQTALFMSNHNNSVYLYLGPCTNHNESSITGIEKTAEDNELVVYWPVLAYCDWNSGTTLDITLATFDKNYYIASTTFTSDIPLSTGGHLLTLKPTLVAK